ncbi:MAG: phosphopantothenate/pantothenate synthetase [Methanobacteriota archaeon]|nr:MAG: phosphopantothenate/pantothenate synthetase [Euryarchaeota archaeon]
MIPDSHPRSQSLRIRHALIEGMKNNIVAESGLIAHGRGEAFDYLLGEKTHEFAKKAIGAAAALLKLATHPVISVNGNTAILCGKEMVDFSNKTGIPLEINLFYRRPERYTAIKKHLEELGAEKILGADESRFAELPNLESFRRVVDKDGILIADVVFVPLEDGDRTEALVKLGKKVITVDLNPLSRTALAADVSIVDNIQRVFPILDDIYHRLSRESAEQILSNYDNHKILEESLQTISQGWIKEFSLKYQRVRKQLQSEESEIDQ